MARTNIDLEERLVQEAMRRCQLRTKREAVHLALRRVAGDPMSLEEAPAMEGSGCEGDLDAIRRPRLEGTWS